MIIKEMNKLGYLKGFETGSTSSNKDQMIIDFEDRRFVATFQEIENPDEDMFKDIDKYLKVGGRR